MCKIQIIDFLTLEILFEEECEEFNTIRELLTWIDECKESETIGCYITDQNRTHECEFHSYTVDSYDEEVVVKVYCETNLLNVMV